jgi:hypothetical protein
MLQSIIFLGFQVHLETRIDFYAGLSERKITTAEAVDYLHKIVNQISNYFPYFLSHEIF